MMKTFVVHMGRWDDSTFVIEVKGSMMHLESRGQGDDPDTHLVVYDEEDFIVFITNCHRFAYAKDALESIVESPTEVSE
jgi:hypothetical protein